MHAILPNVYRACESVSVTQKSACEPVGVTQKTHDHNYFRTRSVVNKVHFPSKTTSLEKNTVDEHTRLRLPAHFVLINMQITFNIQIPFVLQPIT